MRSVEIAGFSRDPSSWFISKHDVYGATFREKWSKEPHINDDVDLLNLSELDDALDDINLVHESFQQRIKSSPV